MKETDRFKEGLAAVISAAKLSDNHVTKAQIESCFKGITLNEEQLELVCSYLELNKITVDDVKYEGRYSELFNDFKEEEPQKLSDEDSKVYDMYLEDLDFIQDISYQEEKELVEQMLNGNPAVKDRLIEARLKKVVEMAARYCGKGVPVSDIIQEGNVALMMAVDSYTGGDYDAWINSEVEEAFKAAVIEQEGHLNTGKYLATQANALMELTAQIAEELGREASLDELASRMNLSEDAVRDIMKTSMDALNIAEATGSGETYGQTETLSDEDKRYFEAAYEDGGAQGDGWKMVSEDEMESEDMSDEDEAESDDGDGNTLENGWTI